MAAEAQKAKEGDKPAAPKKKGLPPVILIAVGAILGGAGTVFLLPKPKPVVHEAPREPEYEEVQFEDKMAFTFNPKTERGRGNGKVAFFFVVKMKKDVKEEEKVKKLIKAGWEGARSRVLEILTAQTTATLGSSEGKMQVRKLIADELAVNFFRKGEATITTIYWDEFFIN